MSLAPIFDVFFGRVPELPSITIYVERLEAFTRGRVLNTVRLHSPFLLRTVEPPLAALFDKEIVSLANVGKRIVIGFADDLFLVIHLMIAGRLRWKKPGFPVPKRGGLAAFDFDHGTLLFTEASKKKRASMHVVRGRHALADFDRGGIDVLACSLAEFRVAMLRENHTLKRALTDPRVLSGIGNAFSDEILHAARLSPFRQTQKLADTDWPRLFDATRTTMTTWIERLRNEVGDGFPDKVTAFHDAMSVHGRYKKPCPVCQTPIQRIVYAQNEANYCTVCQTDGRLLADRALSRLLKKNWPKTLEELEERKRGA